MEDYVGMDKSLFLRYHEEEMKKLWLTWTYEMD